MAFCSKCGAKLEDGTKFCATCGAVQEGQDAASVQEAPVETPVAEKKPVKLDNKTIGLIAMGVVAIIAIVLIFSIGKALFGGGYKKPIKTLVKAVNSQSTDVDDVLDVLPKFVGNAYDDALSLVKDIDKDLVEELEDGIAETLEGMYEALEDTYGKNVKVSYEIKDKEKIDKDDCEDIADAYASIVETVEDTIGIDLTDTKDLEDMVDEYEDQLEDMDISAKQIKKAIKLVSGLANDLTDIKISKGYILEVELEIEGKDDDDSMDLEVCVVKMNGKWCIDILSTYAEMSGEKAEDIVGDLMSRFMY